MDGPETEALLERIRRGDESAWEPLVARHRARLLRMVRVRLDRRIRARVDASDVVQEVYVDALRRLGEYAREPQVPFFVWLRFLTGQKVLELQRRHLGAQQRDARREIRLHRGPLPAATSTALAHQLLGTDTSPSRVAIREERRIRLQTALNALDPPDREVLSLRHFEQLNNRKVAGELGIGEAAASKRYLRAVKRLKGLLGGSTGAKG